jgi:hypothetical protein
MFGIFLPTAPAVVSRCCQKCPTRTPSRLPILRLQLTYAVYGRVADGARTASSGATIRRHRLPRVAMRCKTGLDKPFSLLMLAQRFSMLRAEWCQQWCQILWHLQGKSLCTIPTYCDRAPALARIVRRASLSLRGHTRCRIQTSENRLSTSSGEKGLSVCG